MLKLEKEKLYAISVNGAKPTVWQEKFPSKEQLEFEIAPQHKSVEVITKTIIYSDIETSEKLELINNMEVLDYDVDTDQTLIYVHIEDSKEHRAILRGLGATEEDFEIMTSGLEGDNLLDIALFPFQKLGAEFWSVKKGFYVDWKTGLNK